MAIILEEKQREQVPAGTHTGLLYQIIDLGTQYNEAYNKEARRIRLTWELTDELMGDGRPFVVSGEYSLSLAPKSTLTNILTGWLGKAPSSGFDITSLLGKAGNVSVVHNEGSNGKIYANVSSVTGLKKTETPPKGINEPVLLELNENFNQSIYESLPDFLKEKISKSPEYLEITGQTVKSNQTNTADELNDEIPF